MINQINFKGKNLTSNSGIFPLYENAKNNGIFDIIEENVIFDSKFTNKIKMNHIKTMICGNLIGIDKLERIKLLQDDPLMRELDISVKEPETVSRFLSNFDFKSTYSFRTVNFIVFNKLLKKSKLTSITIDIDSSVINTEGNQEGSAKGYNTIKRGNKCFNDQFAFCDELKAFVTGYVRPGNTYTSNGTAELIREIVANIKTEKLDILFRMDSGYFDQNIIETIESLGCKYLIKAKLYPTLKEYASATTNKFTVGEEGRETTEIQIKLESWDKKRRFVVRRILKPRKDREQLSFEEGWEYEYFLFVTNTDWSEEKVVISYEKRGNAENYIKEAKYDMSVGHLQLKSFYANEAIFQMMMLTYNLFLMFKLDSLDATEYRQQIKTFRLKYVFVPAQIIKTGRIVIMKMPINYPYKKLYTKYIA